MLHTIQTIAPICHNLHISGNKIVLATGFFDLLHAEHISFLKQARAEGNIFIIAVESDARARKLKGEGRPVEAQQLRAKNLTPHADYIITLPDNFNTPDAHHSLIQAVHPDILAVSSHTQHQEVKARLVEEFGGQLKVVHSHNPNISTTKTISKNQL